MASLEMEIQVGIDLITFVALRFKKILNRVTFQVPQMAFRNNNSS